MQSRALSENSQRVIRNTQRKINEKIKHETLGRLIEIGDNKVKIESRLDELRLEWDIERAIEANASTISLIGLGLGMFKNKKWFLLPTAVAGFLFQHAIQGWCPPVPILRRLGFRTQREIDNERRILKMRQGDFDSADKSSTAQLEAIIP